MEAEEDIVPKDLALRSLGALGLEGPSNTSLLLLPRHLIALEHSLQERPVCW